MKRTATIQPPTRRTASKVRRGLTLAMAGAVSAAGLLVSTGCETDSFLDPSVVGRWEPTPVTMPILTDVDVSDFTGETVLPITQVRPEDLEPDVQEYVIGPGDILTFTIFELIVPGQEAIYQRIVDETGSVRLPVIGAITAAGLSPSQLEDEIRNTLERKGILREATVSVLLNQSGQNVYHIIGTPREGTTRFGTYGIPQPNFRLLQAIALAGGVADQTRTVLIFRQTPLTPGVAGSLTDQNSGEAQEITAPATDDPEALLDSLLEGGEMPADDSDVPAAEDRPAPPSGIEAGLDSAPGGSAQWVYVDGKWVPAGGSVEAPIGSLVPGNELQSEDIEDELASVITQRIIEVPYEKLLDGDMRYNIVVRPGDVIRVPSQNAGFIYLMGQIARPGTYTVPGERRLTIKQAVASAGGLNGLANPRKVDLVRRIGSDTEVTVRLDVKAIFDATEPDLYLQADDLLNVGSSFYAVPLAVIRNGFRASYGFGFVVDRNFGNDVFGAPPSSTR
ncbi:MAG: polysaccharide biosynthesis/export family protein [Planctomycetota bacterium]